MVLLAGAIAILHKFDAEKFDSMPCVRRNQQQPAARCFGFVFLAIREWRAAGSSGSSNRKRFMVDSYGCVHVCVCAQRSLLMSI